MRLSTEKRSGGSGIRGQVSPQFLPQKKREQERKKERKKKENISFYIVKWKSKSSVLGLSSLCMHYLASLVYHFFPLVFLFAYIEYLDIKIGDQLDT